MAKEVVVAAFKGIPAAEWLKIVIIALSSAVFIGIVYAGYMNNNQQTSENSDAIKALNEEYAEQRMQNRSVSRSLAATESALTSLVERMNTHDIEDSRREAEIRHNEAEINRLRDDGNN